MASIAVIGAGTWGISLAILLHQNGHKVVIWSSRADKAERLKEKREDVQNLPGVHIPEEIQITADLGWAVTGREVLVLAVASPYIRSTSAAMRPWIKRGRLS